MIDKEKQKLNMKVQWAKFAVVLALYLLFLVWVESWLGLIVVPFIIFLSARMPLLTINYQLLT
jgi:signal peptidase I